MQQLILRAWHHKNAFFYLVLVPLSWIFGLLAGLRRLGYRLGILKSYALPTSVIVVGNINMGGSGKTPVVMWLVEQLKKSGYTPAVISRGYGANNTTVTQVKRDSLAVEVGDEPLLIAQRCHCPVWVGVNRVQVGQALLEAHPDCDVIISDDGLQHYRLKRDIEIAVVDKETAESQHLLPAGPLREPFGRLQTVDLVISNGEKTILEAYTMQLEGEQFYNLAKPTDKATHADFKGKTIKALAGIGKPERFFKHLKGLGLDFTGISFADHHVFTAQDVDAIACDVLIMTEKDAVKCQPFAKDHHWVLPVDAKMDDALLPALLEKLQQVAVKIKA